MSLFSFKRKNEKVKEENSKEIKNIKVLGTGCKSCHLLYENVKQVILELGISIEVEYITDMEKIVEYNVLSTPALIINDEVISTGRLLKVEEIKKYV